MTLLKSTISHALLCLLVTGCGANPPPNDHSGAPEGPRPCHSDDRAKKATAGPQDAHAPEPTEVPAPTDVPKLADTPNIGGATPRVAVLTSTASAERGEIEFGTDDWGIYVDSTPEDRLRAARAMADVIESESLHMERGHVVPLSDLLGIGLAVASAIEHGGWIFETKPGAPWVGIRHHGGHYETINARNADGNLVEFFAPDMATEADRLLLRAALDERMTQVTYQYSGQRPGMRTKGDGDCLFHAIVQGVALRAGDLDRVPVLAKLVPEHLRDVAYGQWPHEAQVLVANRLRTAYADHVRKNADVDTYGKTFQAWGRLEMKIYAEHLAGRAVVFTRNNASEQARERLRIKIEQAPNTLAALAAGVTSPQLLRELHDALETVERARHVLAQTPSP